MSKYVECQLDVTYDEFRRACESLGLKIGTRVRMYKADYETEISGDELVGLRKGKLIFDDMYGGKLANRIIEKVYTDRLKDRFGEITINRTETDKSIILKIRR